MFSNEIPIMTLSPSTLTYETCTMAVIQSTSSTLSSSSSSSIINSPKTTLTRTFSDGELSTYSSVASVRDAMASARRTRESLRKSRASLYALRQDAEQTLRDARTLRREMQELLMDSNTFQGHSTALASSVYESDQESDCGVLSHPTVHSGMSDMTFDY